MLLGGAAGARIVELHFASKAPSPKFQIFLLDTGIERKATVFIDYFLKKMQGITFQSRCELSLIPTVEDAIDAFLAGNSVETFELIHDISTFQFKFLRGLIPEKYRRLWAASLTDDFFKLKVCGAGGGGFLLGTTPDFEATKKALAGQKLLPVMKI